MTPEKLRLTKCLIESFHNLVWVVVWVVHLLHRTSGEGICGMLDVLRQEGILS